MNSLQNILYPVFALITFISIPLSLLSGLALAPLFIVLGVFSFLSISKAEIRTIFSSSKNFKLFSLLSLWALVSCLWTINFEDSFGLWIRFTGLVIIGFISISVVKNLDDSKSENFSRVIIYSFFLSLVLVLVELMTDGMITRYFRGLISGGDEPFILHLLNRGACYLALAFWPFILALKPHQTRNGRFFLVLFWVLTLGMLSQLDSLSAMVGFLCGSITFLLVIIFRGKLNFLIILASLLILSLFPVAITKLSPQKIIADYSLPESAEHRLYIWKFVSNNALKNNVLGWGVNASRNIPSGKERIEGFNADSGAKLPLHPHSNILQIWLELGVVGLIISIAIVFSVLSTINKSVNNRVFQATSLAAAITYISIGMTAFGVWQHWWVSAGFLIAAIMTLLISQETNTQKL